MIHCLKLKNSRHTFGVTFDERMTRKQHITSAEAKARRKMNIMRKLAGTKWGAKNLEICLPRKCMPTS
jgi:hypothetical protein